MQYIELKEQLNDFIVFNIADIRKIEADFDLRRLNEWQKKNYIKKIRQGFYMFSDLPVDEAILLTIANHIYEPSYISLEMALSLHGLIPEAVYAVTSVTSQKSRTWKTSIGNFTYRHIKPKLLFGYELREHVGQRYQVAEIEKAVLDYLYLNPKINDGESFVGMRFNTIQFREKADMEKFDRYTTAFDSKAFAARAKRFIKYIYSSDISHA